MKVMVLLALVTGACLESQGKSVDCGQGDAFTFGDATYCVYRAAIIIEGFDCPPTLPERHDAPDGVVVCGPRDEDPPGGWDDLVEAWQQGQGPVGDVGDAQVAEVSEVDPGPISACDEALDVGFGDLVVGAPDSNCTALRKCFDGVVAACDHGNLACDCSFGELRCLEIAGDACPAHAATLDAPCLPGLGSDACGAGLFCDGGTCKPLPALCDATACFDDADCSGACADGDALSGALGRCVEPVQQVGGDCWDPKDCPSGWQCGGVFQPCVACETCGDPGSTGRCQPSELTSALGLVAGVDFAPLAVWWVYEYALVECPTVTIEVRDELTGAWEQGPSVTCGGVLRPELGMATPVQLPTIPRGDFDYAWVRVSGTLLTGCFGETPAECTGEPVSVSSPATLIRR